MKKDLTQEQFQELYAQFLSMLENNEKPKKKSKPRKRPNGSGTINYLGGNRLKPWQPMITIGTDFETGKQIRKTLPCCETREQAQESLDLYNLMHKGYVSKAQASKLEAKLMPTFAEVWEKVKEEKQNLKSGSLKAYETAYNRLKKIHDMKMDKIDLNVLQPLFDDMASLSKRSISLSKVVCNLCFGYAMRFDLISKDYSLLIQTYKYTEQEEKHKSLTHEEIKYIYKQSLTDDLAKLMLIYIYTGFRATELLELKEENIHFEYGYIIGGKKTKAGTDRIVPIHSCIKDYLFLLIEKKYLSKKSYNSIEYLLLKFNKAHSLNLKYHDFRHTFATLCVEYEVNDYYAKCILGHAHNDITKDIYTHAAIEKLKSEIEKIPHPSCL